MRRKTKSVRLEEETISVIDENLVGPQQKCSSLSGFIQQAVENQADTILKYVVDGRILRKLIRHLNNIEEIDEAKPTCSTEARWGAESFDDPIEFEVSEEALSWVNQFKRNTGLKQSTVFRICIFRQLCVIATNSDHPYQYDWKAEEIKRRWKIIEDDLISTYTQFHEVLLRRFVASSGTIDSIKNDQTAFEHFSEIYVNEFHDSETYEQIIECCGERAFHHLEFVISCYTEFSFPEKATAGYLGEDHDYDAWQQAEEIGDIQPWLEWKAEVES